MMLAFKYWKAITLIGAIVALLGAEMWLVYSAHKRGYQKAQLENELSLSKQQIQAVQWRENMRLEQEKKLIAIAASYAALQSQSIQTERENHAKLELIAQTASDIYSRDCFNAIGLQQLNKQIRP